MRRLLPKVKLWAAALGVLTVLAPAVARAVPYNHISADGLWGVGEWDVNTERRCSNSITPWGTTNGNPQSLLVTWDHDSLYIGVIGNTWSNAELVYIYSDGLAAAPTNADFYQGFTTPGWGPQFVFGTYDMQWGNVSGGNPQLRRIGAGGVTTAYTGGRFGVKDKDSDGGLDSGLVEIAIPWADLGVHANGHIKVAVGVGWALQKGPPVNPAGGLGGESGDELCGANQVGGTDGNVATLDTPVDIAYDLNGDGVPDSYVDTTPPTLVGVSSNSPAPAYIGGHSQVLLQFSEIVAQAGAQTVSNYSLDGVVTPISAVRQSPDSSQVLLTFGAPLSLGTTHSVRAINIKDRAGNTIVNNGTTNVGCLCIRRIVFRVNMSLHLRQDPPPDSVVIIGNTAPLTFLVSDVCKIKLYDDGTHGDAVAGDSNYAMTIDFSRSQVCGASPDTTTLEYEFNHRCTEYEGMHHLFAMTCGRAIDTLQVWWQDIAPSNFTAHPVDVIFRCDAGVTGDWHLWVDGSAPPLYWHEPSENPMRDDGVFPDSAAGDRRWTRVVRFPAGTYKSVDFKYLVDSSGTFAYECGNNRNVYLNDAAYDTVGGAMGPITLTPAGIFGQNCVAVSGVDGGSSARFELRQNLPNPFQRSTRITFVTRASAQAELGIYDLSGRLVRKLFQGAVSPGEQSVTWDGRDASGRAVASGVYFYRLRVGGEVLERRLMLLH